MTDRAYPSSPPVEVRLQFETLLMDLSARLVKARPEEIDAEIRTALKSVLDFFGADRCGVVGIDLHRQTAHVTHAAYTEGVPFVPPDLNLVPLFPWVFARILDLGARSDATSVIRLEDLPAEARVDRATCAAYGVRSNLTIPIRTANRVRHLLSVHWTRDIVAADLLIARLRLLGEILVSTLEAHRAAARLDKVRDRLDAENVYLQQAVKDYRGAIPVVGQSRVIRRALEQARQVAPAGSTVLLVGETGTGKERFASYIHDLSPRHDRPMIRVNCAAIPTTLIENELFGREKGAYTGALSRQAGRFELAQGSTLFLDEIGDLPPEVQVKLLRVLQEKQIERLGSPRSISVDVRVIAATNSDLEQAVRDGRFREDLFYRLNVFPIVIPPLRERPEDIPLLVDALIDELAGVMNKRVESVAKASMDALQAYSWPGNIRELRNVLERAMIVATGPVLHVEIARQGDAPSGPTGRTLREVEREHILGVLRQTGWRIRGARGAAEILGLKATTLEYRMAKLGIARRDPNTA